MILFDINQIFLAALFEQIGATRNQIIDITLVRHMILNIIRIYVKKFKSEYGPEIVLALDNRNYWRKKYFSNYKCGRKKSRDSSGYDWDAIFEALKIIREEFKEYCPYKVLDVDGAEADDIIATLTEKFAPFQKILILSSDRDFCQLQKYSNVDQYAPMQKKFIKEKNPELELKQKIIRGEKSDGIPSILSADNVFVEGIRQKPILESKLLNWLNQSPEEFCNEEMLRNYHRNQTLIDFSKIPSEIKENILNTYENTHGKSKQVFMNYMIKYNLKNLISDLNDF